MSQQIRSADLLVRTALSDKDSLQALKTNPPEALKNLAKEATQSLPSDERMPVPYGPTKAAIWLIVVIAFAIVMVYAAYVLGSRLDTTPNGSYKYSASAEMILTVFTTVVGFLAGLLSPSPISRKNG
jgi:hypothetical protein